MFKQCYLKRIPFNCLNKILCTFILMDTICALECLKDPCSNKIHLLRELVTSANSAAVIAWFISSIKYIYIYQGILFGLLAIFLYI